MKVLAIDPANKSGWPTLAGEAAVGKIREFVGEVVASYYAAKREPSFDHWNG